MTQDMIKAYLDSQPSQEELARTIDLLRDYYHEQDRLAAQADLAFKNELPEEITDKEARERFRRLYNQLTKQGLTIKFQSSLFGGDYFSWRVYRIDSNSNVKSSGSLVWEKSIAGKKVNKWTLFFFRLKANTGEDLTEFNYLHYRD